MEDSGWFKKFWSKLNKRRPTSAVGVSGTGDGDYFIRHAAAATIVHRVRYLNEPLDKAANRVLKNLSDDGGIGGVIALDNNGHVSMPLNCPGMYRGVIRQDGIPKTAIFSDEEVA